MQPNPILKKLGFSATDRVAIIHTDDIGMCQASVSAFSDLQEFGLISSGAIMVPCPWFLEAVDLQKNNPAADLGVHATLTSEWRNYRWGPLSTRDPASGLLDEQGFFHHRSQAVQEKADPKAVAIELEAQLKQAYAAGLSPTHMDTHMGSVGHPKFMQSYIDLAIKYHVPPMVFRMDEAGWRARGMSPEVAKLVAGFVVQLEQAGLPLLDHLVGLPLDQVDDRLVQAKTALAALKPGITHFIIHPSKDTPELRAITKDWKGRVEDYQTFMRGDLRQFINDQGIQVIGYRQIQQLMQ